MKKTILFLAICFPYLSFSSLAMAQTKYDSSVCTTAEANVKYISEKVELICAGGTLGATKGYKTVPSIIKAGFRITSVAANNHTSNGYNYSTWAIVVEKER